jgi:flagellar FliJ protein
MANLKSVHLAIEQATRRRDELAKALLQAQRNKAAAQDQLGQLEGYANETDARLMGSGGSMGLSAELIRNHYQFMDRLQHAIGIQSSTINNMDWQLDRAQNALLQAEFRLAGLKQWLKKQLDAAEAVQRRKEQRQMDEFAAIQYSRTHRVPLGE